MTHESMDSGLPEAREVYDDQAWYMAHKGVRCPICHSQFLDGGFVETNEGVGDQSMQCEVCYSAWVDHYKLSHIAELEPRFEWLKPELRVLWVDPIGSRSYPGKIVSISSYGVLAVQAGTSLCVLLDTGRVVDTYAQFLRMEAGQPD